jgi:hypothetical protein
MSLEKLNFCTTSVVSPKVNSTEISSMVTNRGYGQIGLERDELKLFRFVYWRASQSCKYVFVC